MNRLDTTDYRQHIDTLETFFAAIDREALFESRDPAHYRKLRESICDSLFQLLVWQRALLEADKGIRWPYHALKERVSHLEMTAARSPRTLLGKEAVLFLARLPFPGQWRWLQTAEETFADSSEIRHLLGAEKKKIFRKVEKKRQKKFKIRHFCQILKHPRPPREKGILRIFSLPYLFVDRELLNALGTRYLLFVEPAAGIVYRHSWFRAFSRLKDPCLFGMASEEDRNFLDSQPDILTTPLAHADFLEADVAVELDASKTFDIVFNGTYDEMPRKRHALMLSLMHHPKLADKTALFIGRGKKNHVDGFREAVRQEGLAHRVEVLANLPRKDVPAYLARCRMGVHLALHENGCRAIYEFFRSDIPCVVSTCTGGVNFEIFNAQTGLAVPDRQLPDAVSHVLMNRHRFSPRNWFLTRSGSEIASLRLNRQLKTIFEKLGYEWTEDIVPLGSSGASRYVKNAHLERFSPDFQELYDIFGTHSRLPIRLAAD